MAIQNKKELLKYLWFYREQKENPYIDKVSASNNSILWAAEQLLYEEFDTIKITYKDDLVRETPIEFVRSWVYAFIGKWNPYECEDIYKYYIDICKSHPKD